MITNIYFTNVTNFGKVLLESLLCKKMVWIINYNSYLIYMISSYIIRVTIIFGF